MAQWGKAYQAQVSVKLTAVLRTFVVLFALYRWILRHCLQIWEGRLLPYLTYNPRRVPHFIGLYMANIPVTTLLNFLPSINHTLTQRADPMIFLNLFRARNIRTVTVSVVLTTRRNCTFRTITGIVMGCVIDCDVEFCTHSFRILPVNPRFNNVPTISISRSVQFPWISNDEPKL